MQVFKNAKVATKRKHLQKNLHGYSPMNYTTLKLDDALNILVTSNDKFSTNISVPQASASSSTVLSARTPDAALTVKHSYCDSSCSVDSK